MFALFISTKFDSSQEDLVRISVFPPRLHRVSNAAVRNRRNPTEKHVFIFYNLPLNHSLNTEALHSPSNTFSPADSRARGSPDVHSRRRRCISTVSLARLH